MSIDQLTGIETESDAREHRELEASHMAEGYPRNAEEAEVGGWVPVED